MDTRLLRSFLAVARTGSFTDAALELGITQSTVTGHVQRLETQLGGRLLDRLPRGVRVTDVGGRVIEHADGMLAAEARLRAACVEDAERPSGTVRILAPESLCTYRLPTLIGTLREAEPLVQVWLSPGGIAAAVDAVRSGAVELALSIEPRLPVTELKAERIGSEPIVILDRPGGRDAGVTWQDLARRDAVMIEEGCGYSDDVAARLAATGVPAGRRSRFGSVEAIKRCVAAGLGWAALPAVTAEDDIASGSLAVLDGPELSACDVYVLTHPRRHRSPAVEAVMRELHRTWQG